MALPEPDIRVRGVEVRYGRLKAVRGIDLEVQPGEAVGLLGANGAGKTTMLNTLSGFLSASAGTIELFGKPVVRAAPHLVVRQGLLHVSQERDLFGDLSVLDNLRLGALARGEDRFDANVERVFGFFPRLRERAQQRANTMSGGEQQMLAIGRALMAEPRALMLDEPSAGLSPFFVDEIGAILSTLRKSHQLSILLVEQNMRLAARIIDRFYILRDGVIVAQGTAPDLEKNHEDLAREFYL